MSDNDWYDDGERRDPIRQAERATRWGWAAIAGVTGFLAVAVLALAVVVMVVVVALGYSAVSMD
ncbi:hypothetical protein ACIP10_27505 [Streptomyces galbus]|uniref:hypothetical protein n=1 Tax=Streptomyces galbus TaxID=33898 RepID=UPI0037AF848D